MTNKIQVILYNKNTLSTLDWPQNKDGEYARLYLMPLFENGIAFYIKNAHTTLNVLQAGDIILPITITQYHPHNSFVCSPYNHYFTYSLEELDKLNSPIFERLIRMALAPIGTYYRRAGFDGVVFVNNWLLSTNLYPQLTPQHIKAISSFLIKRFPNRPIVFRSVDERGNPLLLQTLAELNYRLVFSRHVYYQPLYSPNDLYKKQAKIDLKHYHRSPYQMIPAEQLTEADIPRITALYRMLYLEKYSLLNPQFTEAFFKLVWQNQLLHIKAFKKEGRIDAVMGYVARNGVITPPLFGYDTHLPQKLGLYRLISTQTALDALENRFLVHWSAGAGQFKRLRGGQPVCEYNAVYDHHLPSHRRLPWTVLRHILNYLAVPIIKKREL